MDRRRPAPEEQARLRALYPPGWLRPGEEPWTVKLSEEDRVGRTVYRNLTPEGRRAFADAVDRVHHDIATKGYVDGVKDSGERYRLKLPILPPVYCGAQGCQRLEVHGLRYCTRHYLERR